MPDAVSGFRAASREAARRINILSTFSYTIEMLIQAGRKRMAMASVPISVNPMTRRSRLYSTVSQFIQRSGATLVSTYAMCQPLKLFVVIDMSGPSPSCASSTTSCRATATGRSSPW